MITKRTRVGGISSVSHIRWIVGRKIVAITEGDSITVPDDGAAQNVLVLHFDSGDSIEIPIIEADRLHEKDRAGRQLSDVHRELERQQVGPDPPCALAAREFDGHPNEWWPGTTITVRAWFRKMRAADFERDTANWSAYSPTLKPDCRGHLDDGAEILRFVRFHWLDLDRWTLFDTMTVVDRATAAHYLRPELPPLTLAALFDHLKEKNPFLLFGIPIINRDWVPRDRPFFLRRGDWLHIGGLGTRVTPADVAPIERSTAPMFSSKVPTSHRGITLADLQQWIDDEQRRFLKGTR